MLLLDIAAILISIRLLFWILVLLTLNTWVLSIRLAVIVILVRLIIIRDRVSLRTIVSSHDLEVLEESNSVHGHVSSSVPAIIADYTEID